MPRHVVLLRVPALWGRATNRQRGTVTVLTAVMLPLIILVLILGIDVSYALSERNRMQGAADNAARAAAQISAVTGATTGMVVTEGLNLAAANGMSSSTGAAVTVNWPPLSGAFAGKSSAVEVTIVKNVGLLYSLNITNWLSSFDFTGRLAVRAVANTGSLPCLAALNTANSGGDTGITVTGSTNLKALCGVWSNRGSNTTSVTATNSALLETTWLYMMGDTSDYGSSVKATYKYSNLSDPYVNPYANVSVPTSSSTVVTSATPQDVSTLCSSSYNTGTNTLTMQPGYYANGMVFNSSTLSGTCAGTATVEFQPGVYYLGNVVPASFILNASVNLKGSGVTLILLDGGDFKINAGNMDLYAPITGVYGNVTMITTGSGNGSGINSTGSTIGTGGAIVAPGKNITVAGNVSGGAGCFSIIAKALQLSGLTGTIGEGCVPIVTEPSKQRAWRLVE